MVVWMSVGSAEASLLPEPSFASHDVEPSERTLAASPATGSA